ncbi:MAG TPA: type II toxin-antitoxin system HicA family toxin [bacterium]|nr:type II toxin-antitoxin system HicA family toxin [bacterium]
MPRLPRVTARKAEQLLLRNGFRFLQSRGSHRIYMKGKRRIVVPFHSGKTLHPKIIKRILGVLDLSTT